MFSGVLGRLSLPDCLPFSKPKVNWLLHPVMVAWKQLFSRDSLHASVVNAICHFRLSLKECETRARATQKQIECHFRLSLKECETRARATQKQIESRLTRDLFAFRLSFLVKNQQNARARTFFFGKVCKCAFFFVPLQGDVGRMRVTHVRGPTNVQTSAIYIAGSALHHKCSGSVVIVHGQGLAGRVTPRATVRVCAR